MKQFLTPLNVFARLAVSFAGHEYLVQADDGVGIKIELQNVRAGWALFKFSPTRHQRGKLLKQLQLALLTAELRLEFQLAGRTVAALGKGASPGFVANAVGLQPLEFHCGQLLRALRHK